MKLFEPLQPVSTPAERRRRRAMYWMVAVQGTLAALLVYFAAVLNSLPLVLTCLVIIFVGNVVLIATVSRVVNNTWAARRALREANYRICPGCSYDLSASAPDGVCPECGDPYSPETLQNRWEEAYRKMLEKPGR